MSFFSVCLDHMNWSSGVKAPLEDFPLGPVSFQTQTNASLQMKVNTGRRSCLFLCYLAWSDSRAAHNHGNYLGSIPSKTLPAECKMHFEEKSWKKKTASHIANKTCCLQTTSCLAQTGSWVASRSDQMNHPGVCLGPDQDHLLSRVSVRSFRSAPTPCSHLTKWIYQGGKRTSSQETADRKWFEFGSK